MPHTHIYIEDIYYRYMWVLPITLSIHSSITTTASRGGRAQFCRQQLISFNNCAAVLKLYGKTHSHTHTHMCTVCVCVCVCLHSRTAGVPHSHATQAGRQAGIKSSQYTKRSSNNNNCVYLAQAILTHTHTHTPIHTHRHTNAQPSPAENLCRSH